MRVAENRSRNTGRRLAIHVILVTATAGPGPLLAATRGGAPGRPADGAPGSVSALVEAHLGQVRTLEAAAAGPGDATDVERLRGEVRARRDAWTGRVAREGGLAGPLLEGLPGPVRKRAAALGSRTGSLVAALGTGLDLRLLLALVPARHPGVATARESWRSVLRQFDQASYLEDLVARYRSFVREIDPGVGPRSHREMPGKSFAFPSVLALKGQLVELRSEEARVMFQKTLREALNALARSYVEIRYLGESARLLRESRGLFDDMVALTRTQFTVGVVSQSDLLKAESTLASLDNQVVTLERQQNTEGGRLLSLLDLPVGTPLGPTRPLGVSAAMPDLDRLLERADHRNQDLALARTRVELMEAQVRLAETRVLPRASTGMSLVALSMGAEAGPTRSPAGAFPGRVRVGPDQAAFGVNAAWIDEIRVRVGEVRARSESVRNGIAFSVKDAHFRWDRGRRDLATWETEVTPRSSQAFQVIRQRYNTGTAPFIEFLDAGRTYIEALMKAEEARRDLWRAAIDLQDAQGLTVLPLLEDAASTRGGPADAY